MSAQQKRSEPTLGTDTPTPVLTPESAPELGSNSANAEQLPAPDGSAGEYLALAAAEAQAAEAPLQHMPAIIEGGAQQIAAYQPAADLSELGTLRTQTSISAFAAAANEIKASWDQRQAKEAEKASGAPDSGITAGALGSSTPQASSSGITEGGATTTGESSTQSGITAGLGIREGSAGAQEAASDSQASNEATTETVPADVMNYRKDRFSSAINESLGSAGVYQPVTLESGQLSADAQFEGSLWKMTISEDALACDASGVGNVANSVYHEARHAEQKHLLMRMKAGEQEAGNAWGIQQTDYIQQFSQSYNVHKDAVSHAAENPIPTTHPLIPSLQRLWESSYGEAGLLSSKIDKFRNAADAFMDKTGTDLEAIDSAWIRKINEISTNVSNRMNAITQRWFGTPEDAKKASAEHAEVKAELQRLQAIIAAAGMTYKEAYDQYRSRLYERDAFAAGDAVEAAMSEQPPTAS